MPNSIIINRYQRLEANSERSFSFGMFCGIDYIDLPETATPGRENEGSEQKYG